MEKGSHYFSGYRFARDRSSFLSGEADKTAYGDLKSGRNG